MTYSLIITPKAEKELAKLDKTIASNVRKKVYQLVENPHRFIEKVVGSNVYRARTGDYRIFLDVEKSKKDIIVHAVRHRSNAYKP
ncbi:type II toxin-antitoxin system RelE/ParE family toxin [Candidatus Micrarchaeota archaeon]|nr:type II toxin-antitoxin system RelE/ParE family toxin [Candidatus Micrarchaeota archaeon]